MFSPKKKNIYIYIQKEEGSQNKFKSKIPEGQEHVPRLEPTAPSDWLPFREWGKMSERTLEGGASRVRVTSSDDSCVDRIACAGSPSSSRLYLRMVRWRDG